MGERSLSLLCMAQTQAVTYLVHRTASTELDLVRWKTPTFDLLGVMN